jgi:hypothetical protein
MMHQRCAQTGLLLPSSGTDYDKCCKQ